MVVVKKTIGNRIRKFLGFKSFKLKNITDKLTEINAKQPLTLNDQTKEIMRKKIDRYNKKIEKQVNTINSLSASMNENKHVSSSEMKIEYGIFKKG